MSAAATPILIIDDDKKLCRLIRDYLEPMGYQVEAVHTGPEGVKRSAEGRWQAILLDVMLPFMNGFQVLEQIRKRSTVPIIRLTARIEERDRVAGLNAGADDYLPKPFGPEELLARIRAVLRRSGQQQVKVAPLECGSIHLNPQTREVSRDGERLELTSIEFEILEHLMRSAGRVVSRDEFTTLLYQRQATPYERALDVHISHLRKKLETGARPMIHTIRGVGYLMSATPPESK